MLLSVKLSLANLLWVNLRESISPMPAVVKRIKENSNGPFETRVLIPLAPAFDPGAFLKNAPEVSGPKLKISNLAEAAQY
jgi:hypothetical protein